MSLVTPVTDATFDTALASSSGPVLVDFWAAWCSPCKALKPAIEKLAENHPGITMYALDADANMATAQRFSVQQLPVVLLFANGQVVREFRGRVPLPQLRAALDELG